MRIGQLTKCFEPFQKLRTRLGAPLTGLSPKQFYITEYTKAVHLMWLSMLLAMLSVSLLFHLMCV